jgi:hypothetical protein
MVNGKTTTKVDYPKFCPSYLRSKPLKIRGQGVYMHKK